MIFYRILRSGILWLGAIIGTISIAVFAMSLVLGMRPLNVISGSMEPTIPTGSLVMVKKVHATSLNVGDIVSTGRTGGDGLVTHRVVKLDAQENGTMAISLKGDANSTIDPEPYIVKEVFLYVGHVPVLGFAATLLKTQFGIGVVVTATCALLLLVMFPGTSQNQKTREETLHKETVELTNA